MPIPTVWRSEYQINTTQFATNEFDVEIGALANGRFALTWVSDDSVANDADARFTIRLANGDALSASFDDEVMSGNGAVDEFRAAAAGLPDGRMVFVWDEEAVGGGERDVYAEVRNADGGTFTDRFEITQPSGVATDDQDLPTVLGLSNGNLMVAYRDTQPATDTIRVRPYSIDGVLQGGNTISSTAATDSTNNRPQMAELANGNVVVTWSSGPAPNIQQKFSIRAPSGLPVLAETDVNPEDAVNEVVAGDVAALADGNFVVIFTRQPDANDIQGRLFDQNGNPLGARFDISTGFGINAAATALQDGRFMVVYDTGGNIFGRVMFADGTPDGAQFAIDNAAGSQGDPAIATLADGRVVVSWRSSELGTNDIFAEIYDPREKGLLGAASGLDDDWIGTGFLDQIFGGNGKDTLRGAGGIDYLYGEAGNDTLFGETGDDRLFGGNNDDTLNGGDNNDVLYGGLGNDTLNGDAGDDPWLDGGDGNDTVNGGLGNDRINGGLGNDTLNGGAGIDNITAGAGNDTIDGGADADTIRGEAGDDTINDPSGNNPLLDGGAGIDTINGGTGRDNITGGTEGDILKGFGDADVIRGGNGDDDIDGGAGDDGQGIGGLFGDAGNDTILGGAGIDWLDGGSFNDRLIGGSGNDVVLGGTGSDVFVFEFSTDGNDQVLDWVAANDQIEIDASNFGGGLAAGALAANRLVVAAAPVANQAFGQFLYATGTGQLSWDTDGTGVGAAVTLVRLFNGGVPVNTLAVADFDIVA